MLISSRRTDSVTPFSVASELGVLFGPVRLDSGVVRESDESLMLNVTVLPEGITGESSRTLIREVEQYTTETQL